MSFETRNAFAPDHPTVTYPGSGLRFRGPQGNPDAAHILCLGGTETFGRFVEAPYPNLLADRIDTPVINMGVSGGGLDVILHDGAIAEASATATAIVLQVQGAQKMSNRLFSVHPRRNDRFLRASDILRTIYRDVDFTEFHFTRHMLDHLQKLSPERFEIVRSELCMAWTARMQRLLAEAPVPVHLLWLANHLPQTEHSTDTLGDEPLFITSDILEETAKAAASLTIVANPEDAEREDKPAPDKETEDAAARLMPGAATHRYAAERLAQVL